MRSRHRSFQLLDAIILIAGIAVGLALSRLYDRAMHFYLLSPAPPFGNAGFDRPPVLRLADYLAQGEQILWPAVMTWTFAFVALRLRQPRPRLSRLFRQPGMAGCTTVVTVMPVFLAWKVLGLMIWAGGEFAGVGVDYWFPESFRDSIFWGGSAVAAVWLNLALTRRCAPEPSWIDRLGRVLAFYWILVPLLSVAV